MGLEDFEVQLPTEADLKFKTACVCVHCALFSKVPDLIGCGIKQDCLCIHNAGVTKMNVHKACSNFEALGYCLDLRKDIVGPDGWYKSVMKGEVCFCCDVQRKSHCHISPLDLKCKINEQCLCIDCRAALPFDDEVPMLIAIAGKKLHGTPPAGAVMN
jgi:hypothetical protein